MRHELTETLGFARFMADFFAPEIRAWRGEERLGKVFWGYGIAISILFAACFIGAVYSDRVMLQQFLLMAFAAYTVWILVAVWRCAGNTRELFWGFLARLLTVAWMVNTVLVLTFLQLDLLIRYLQL
ncbi:MAG: hypothetical protein EPO23_11270 [Xanthobacteraceae bacterium]|nr:MAG: hypothetical protein EPO23_11270 [Xanthobacteraceae bacterium]